jgi:RNA polymerase sigma factor (TIGR02999 family)
VASLGTNRINSTYPYMRSPGQIRLIPAVKAPAFPSFIYNFGSSPPAKTRKRRMAQREITLLLDAVRGGERQALGQLYSLVYGELHGLAEARLRRERGGHTLQPTALVNEVYLRLDPAKGSWQNRGHFFGAASRAMRRILVDHARRRLADKRGAGLERVTLADLDVAAPEADFDLIALDEVLEVLERDEPRLANVVMMRVFAGMSIEETAQAMELSPASVKRDWVFARAWLAERVNASG